MFSPCSPSVLPSLLSLCSSFPDLLASISFLPRFHCTTCVLLPSRSCFSYSYPPLLLPLLCSPALHAFCTLSSSEFARSRHLDISKRKIDIRYHRTNLSSISLLNYRFTFKKDDSSKAHIIIGSIVINLGKSTVSRRFEISNLIFFCPGPDFHLDVSISVHAENPVLHLVISTPQSTRA